METITYFNSFTTIKPYLEHEIEQNFNVSVVMPFYKKLEAFKKVFPKNHKYFERNGIEVIIVLDCPNEKDELVEYVKKYPFVNWKIIYNDKPHEWRNPTKPINVGIKQASKKYIMVCSPESEFYTDAIFQLRELLEYYPKHYAIGTVCFARFSDVITDKKLKIYSFVPYGSIMVEKKYLEEIKGYDESLNKWGGDDDNIRARLDLVGLSQLKALDVKLVHREENLTKGNARRVPPLDIIEYLHYPVKTVVNETWGEDFDKVIYNWQDNKFAEEQLCEYLKSFIDYTLIPESTKKYYKKVLLVPTYNEANRISKFLDSNSKYFDAIILLDDASTDVTFEQALHNKLVLKVKKKRNKFNDLENRNILLNLVSFFRCDWICFLDADEIVDERFSNFDSFTDKEQIDSVFVNLIHLWDQENTFNASYPMTIQGISLKSRMYRNIGRAQIISKTGKLHFLPIPYRGRVYHSSVLIKHYGHINKDLRKSKYEFYQKEDTEKCQSSYSHLINNNVKKGNILDIKLSDLQNAINIFK